MEVPWRRSILGPPKYLIYETSQYPEERTSTETLLVAASERGPGQWLMHKNRNDLERSAIVGDSPVRVEIA